MSNAVLEKMEEMIMADEEQFTILMTELSLLVEKLDCSYSRGFFWSARTMMEVKNTLEEKKEILKIYKGIYLTLE